MISAEKQQRRPSKKKMPPYESTIGSSDLVLGQDYFGSTVKSVKQDVSTDVNEDNVEIYVVKRSVSLGNGIIMNERFQREKSLGDIESKSYGSLKDLDKKKRRPRKNKSLPPNPHNKSKENRNPANRTRKKRSKSIPKGKCTPRIESWCNFDEMNSPETQPKKNVGKIKLEEVFKEKIPDMAIVYPRNDAPDRHDENKELIIAKGTWKFPEDKSKPKGSDTWVPTYVQLDLDGSVNVCKDDESNLNNDPEKPCGVWGLSPSNDANAANPSDLWFYPPDEEMDDGFQPIGKWKMMKESLWPPKSISHVVDRRQFKQYKGSLNNVGKLKMPGFFSGK